MSTLDWILFFGFLGYIVWDGMRRGRHAPSADTYFLAGRRVPWWGVGLSIMATQASAITWPPALLMSRQPIKPSVPIPVMTKAAICDP